MIYPTHVRFLPLLLLLAACASNPTFEEGKKLLEAGKTEEAVLRMEQGVREKPQDIEARNHYYRQREMLTGRWLALAENARNADLLDEAEQMYRNVFRIDANNERARGGLNAIAQARRHAGMMREAEALLKKNDAHGADNILRTVLTENPAHVEARRLQKRIQADAARSQPQPTGIKGPFAKPISLEFRDTPLKAAFEVMSRTAGLNFVLDKDVKADTKITLFIRNTTIEEALRLILATNQLDRKLLNENSVLIYPNNAAKNKEYQETVVKSFYLVNTDVKQAQTLIKSMVKSKDVFTDEKLNLLVVKDTPDGIRLAERLIESLDLALPEVMLEVEVLEVARNRMLNLGLDFPDQVGYGLLQPSTTSAVTTTTGTTVATTLGGQLQPGNINLRNRSGLTTYTANPGLLLNLKQQDGDSRLLANPRIRVINREKAKIHIGDKLPIFTTTATANVGVAASVSYLDVGLKLEVEPRVYLDEDVEMKVALEVSSIVKEISGPSNSIAYQVGTRSANTVLRLRDGETQILAGLINDEERSSASRLPGIGDIPLLGRLFSAQTDSRNKTEIVLLITPRVLRNVARPQASGPAVAAGTENSVGAQPLSIKAGALRGNGGVKAAGRPAATPAPAAPEAEAAATPAATPLQLVVPPQAKPGEKVSLLLSLSAPAAVSGQAELVLDPAFFDNAGSTVMLTGSNGNLRGEASVSLRSGIAAGNAQVEIGTAAAVDVSGTALPLSLPPPQSLQVSP